MKKKYYPISNFVCPECETIVPLPRVKKQREKKHIKDIYCPGCRKVRKFVEITRKDYYVTLEGNVIYS